VKSAFFYSDCRKKIFRNIGVRVIDELLSGDLVPVNCRTRSGERQVNPKKPFSFHRG
jgi:hypothetical protein